MSMIDEKKAISKYSSLCSKSEHCEYDIREKMKKDELDDDAKDRVIDFLVKERYIDNGRYAEIFARDKMRFNGWGEQKIRFELRRRKISEDDIENALSEIEDSDFEEKLRSALESKLRQMKPAEPLKMRASLIRFGASRGFQFDLVANVVDKIFRERLVD